MYMCSLHTYLCMYVCMRVYVCIYAFMCVCMHVECVHENTNPRNHFSYFTTTEIPPKYTVNLPAPWKYGVEIRNSPHYPCNLQIFNGL